MLELIDIRTLALSSAFILVTLAIVMVLYQTQRKIYRGFTSWVWAQSLFALAFLMLETRSFLPDIIQIMGGNGALLTGFIFAPQEF
jgi:hypothetical protein